ncbi:MAG: hypothetical protein R3E92_11495 [Burkholderiaceae bacterium]|nr:hypothetical protein [Rhodoferax sp.]MCB2004632.1 hypothetical protein [Rhodoferax sp.]MCB2027767.1 hypothetical protein [Rhodoferax sp.]MCB2043401.1 hypothetical protein [Rhodoferax sp.]MCP5262705.1 hypothetical protein [Rhodoferax sp.]
MGASAHRRPLAAILLAVAPAMLQSQPIYRCGNVYSQMPCTDAIVLDADDRRSAEQKAQTDAATAQAMRQADRMQRDRLAAERAPARSAGPANTGRASPAAPPTTKATARQTEPRATGKTRARPAPKETGDFTASVQQDNKKQPKANAAAKTKRD